jgi:hypothetical protein
MSVCGKRLEHGTVISLQGAVLQPQGPAFDDVQDGVAHDERRQDLRARRRAHLVPSGRDHNDRCDG